MIFQGLSSSANGLLNLEAHEFPGADAPRRSRVSETSSDGGSVTQHVATAANMTLSNSARIVSVGGLFPQETDDSHVERVSESTQALTPHRKAQAQCLHPPSWRKPFTLPDPLAFDDSKAFTLLTGRRNYPHGNALPPKDRMSGEVAPHETIARANALGTLFSFDSGTPREALNGRPRRWSGSSRPRKSFTGPEGRQPGMLHDRPETTMYVPYRPWYSSQATPAPDTKPPFRRDSAADLSRIQSIDASRKPEHRLNTRSLAMPRKENNRPTPTISVTDYSAPRKQDTDTFAVSETPMIQDVPPVSFNAPPHPPVEQEEDTQSSTPLQSSYHITNACPSDRSSASISEDADDPSPEDSPTLASLILRVKSCSEDVSEQEIGEPSPASGSKALSRRHRTIRRRASTGELDFKPLRQRLTALDAKSNPDMRHCVKVQTILEHSDTRFEAYSFLLSSRSSFNNAELSRSQSVSAPELRTPRLQPTILAHLPTPTPERSSLSGETSNMARSSAESNVSKEVADGMETLWEGASIGQICSIWNSRQWAKAESYLTCHLSTLNTPENHSIARRVRHLLGVCASYRGQWHGALAWFLSVINKPVEDARRLDAGDRAAFYWLGDTYAVLNRKEEALLSYCLAGSCNQSGSTNTRLFSHRCLQVDQETLRGMVSKASFKAIWSHEHFHNGCATEGEIFHSSIVSQAAAQARLQHFGRSAEECTLHGGSGTKESTSHHKDNTLLSTNAIIITPSCFQPSNRWPMPSDPLFSMPNVSQGRLITNEIDLLHAVHQYPGTLLPRKTLSLDRVSGFTCESLPQLITTLRKTLHTLAMGWSEVVNPKGLFFRVRYNVVNENIATTNYFSIEIIRVPLRPGYGLAFCTESLCTARVIVTSTIAEPKCQTIGSISSNLSNIGLLLPIPPIPIPSTTEKELKTCLRTTLKSISKRHGQATTSPSPSTSTSISLPTPNSISPHPPILPPIFSTTTSSTITTTPTPAPSLPELGSCHSSPRSTGPRSIRTSTSTHDLSTLVPPEVLFKPSPLASHPPVLPARAKARIEVRKEFNEKHLLGGLMR